MTPPKKILSPTGNAMLSARKVAKRLLCTPDYVGKLCREGKLTGTRVNNIWFVDKNSIANFERSRKAARAARSQELSQQRKIENKTGQQLHREALLSTREVARRLECAPDYVGKLCRERKLDGVRIQNAWFVDEPSIVRFEEGRATARVARAQELSDQRRFENSTYQKLNRKTLRSRFFGNGVLVAVSAAVLVSAVALAGGAALSSRGVVLRGGGPTLAASLAQLQSPFFGTYPTAVKVPPPPGGAFASDLFSKLVGFFSTQKKPVYTEVTPPSTPVQPQVAESTPTKAAVVVAAPARQTPGVVQYNTYPVVERTIERTTVVSGITGDLLVTKLSELKNALQLQISQLQNPGNGSVLNNFDIAQHTSSPTLTDATIPDDITASRYLPLAGGTLTGALVSTASATSTLSNGIDILGGCFSLNGVCMTGGGAGTPGGATTQVQYNDGGSFAGNANFTFNKTTNQLGIANLLATNATTTNSTSTNAYITSLTAVQASTTQISAAQGFFNSIFATSTSATSTFAAAITVGAGQGTSTFAGGLSVDGILNIKSTTATSTFANGINAVNGCFSYNGSCITQNTGSVTSVATDASLTGGPITTTGTLGLNLGNSNWWTALQNFGNASTSQFTATSSVYLATLGGRVGVSTTTPAATLAVQGNAYFSGTGYFGGALTATTSVTSPTVNATTVLQLGGASINTGGTLTNVAYLDQANVFTALNKFANASSTQLSAAQGFFNSIFATSTATSTFIGAVGIGTTSPQSTLAVQGSAYFSGTGYFGGALTATSTLTVGGLAALNAGLTAYASSTVGSGAQAGGLTVLGGATTTGTAYFVGSVGVGNQAPGKTLDVTGTGQFTSTLSLNYAGATSCTGGQALQTNGSGDISCGTISQQGISSAGGWTTNNIGRVTLSTTTDLVAVGASSTLYAKFAVLSGAVATTTLALVPVSSQVANIIDIYSTSGALASVFTAAGSVGIATTAPAATFSVGGSGYFTGGVGVGVVNTSANTINLASGGSYQLGGASINTGGTLTNVAYLDQANVFTALNKFANASSTQLSAAQGFFNSIFATSTATSTFIGAVGIGTTSPQSTLAVQGSAYFSGTGYFGGALTATSTLTVGGLSSLGSASTTQISAAQGFFNSIFATSTSATSTFAAAITVGAGQGTSTFAGGLSVDGILNIKSTSATSTFANGINAVNGCFSYNGTCITQNAGTVTSITAGTGLTGGTITTSGTVALDLTRANTWTGLQTFGAGASSTQLSAAQGFFNNIFATSTATSTFTGGIATNLLNVTSGTASSTFANGINLVSGCLSYNGTCISATVTNPGGSDTQVQYNDGGAFGGSSAFTFNKTTALLSVSSILTNASTTLGGGTATTGLTISGGATTTGNSYFASRVGIGTTSPTSLLAVAGGNITHSAFGNPSLASTVPSVDQAITTYVSGNYAYVAEGADGLKIIDISNPRSPLTVGSYLTGSPAAAQAVVVAGGYAYVTDSSTGLNIIDVSNPKTPTLASSTTAVGRAFRVALSGKYLFMPDVLTATMWIVDISNPYAPAIAGSYVTNAVSGTPYAVAVAGKYAYLGDQGTHLVYVINISNPASTTLVSTYGPTNVTSPTSLYASGKYLYLTDSSKGLSLLNVSDPTSVTRTGVYGATSDYYGVQVAGNYAYLADHTGGNIVVLNVADKTTPALVGSYSVGSNPQNVFVAGKYAYVSSYANGLNVIDINGIEAPSASIGALQTQMLSVADGVNVGGDIWTNGGISAGLSGIFTRGGLSVFGSTTLTDFVARNGTTTNATSTSFFTTTGKMTNLTVTSLAVLSGGLTAYASSTIGNGTRVGGLTISGGATTTGIAYFASSVGIGTTSPSALFSVAGGNGTYIDSSGNFRTNGLPENVYAVSTLMKPVITASSNISDTAVGGGASFAILNTNSATNTSATLWFGTKTQGGNNQSNAGIAAQFVASNAFGASFDAAANVYPATDLEFFTGGSGGTRNEGGVERMRISSYGNVGVGSTSPFARLSIHANPTDTSFTPTLFAVGSSTASATTTLFVVNNNGNVGIGTTSPQSPLYISSGSSVTASFPFRGGVIAESEGLGTGNRFLSRSAGSTEIPAFQGLRSLGTLAAPTAVTTDTGLVSLAGVGYDGTSWANAGTVNIIAEEPWTTGAHGTYIKFTTNASGGTTATEKLRITGAGNVGIGTTTPAYPLNIYSASVAGMYLSAPNATVASGNSNLFIGTTESQAADIGGSLALVGNTVGNGSPVPFGYIWGRKENSTSANELGYLAFGTRTAGAANERLRITSGGNVGIGTTSPSALFAVAGASYFSGNLNVSASTGAFQMDGATVLYASSTLGSVYVGNAGPTAYNANATNNVFLGLSQGNLVTSGANNILIGAASTAANSNLTSGSNNISIGYNISLPVKTANNQLNIGNLIYGTAVDGAGGTYSTGQIGIGSTSPYARFSIQGNNGDINRTLFAIASSTATATTTLFVVNNTGNVLMATTTAPAFGANTFVQTNGIMFLDSTTQNTGLELTGANGAWFDIQSTDAATAQGTVPLVLNRLGGNVYIATSTPFSGNTAKLSIDQTTAGARGLAIMMPTAAETSVAGIRVMGYSPSIELVDKDNVQNWYMGIDDNESNILSFGRGYGPGQGIAAALNISTSDNVGVGTTSPATTLSVAGNGYFTGTLGVKMSAPSAYLASNGTGNIGSANNAAYDIAGGVIGAGSSIYSYGGICTGAGTAACGGSGGVVLGTANTSATVNLTTGVSFFNGGNVGIGTTTPGAKLSVYDSMYGSSVPAATYSGDIQINNGQGSINQNGGLEFLSSASGSGYGSRILSSATGAVNGLLFETRNNSATWSDNLFIQNTTGNVGIGTTSPTTLFSITGGTGNYFDSSGYVGLGRVPTSVFDQGGAGAPRLTLAHDDTVTTFGGGQPALAIVNTNGATSTSAHILFAKPTQGGNIEGNAAIIADFVASNAFGASMAAGANVYPATDLVFATGGSGGTINQAGVERLRITSYGHVVPGADNTETLGSSSLHWDCVYYDATSLGTCASDARLKGNIADLSFGADPLAQASGLRPRTFTFNNNPAQTTNYGFIAQEVQAVAPELVASSSDGYLAVKYGYLQYLTLAALQQLNLNLQTVASSTASSTPQSQSFAASFWSGVKAQVGAWLADSGNGILNLFAQTITATVVNADTVNTKTLCVAKADGSNVCVTGEQLAALLAGGGTSTSTPPASGTGSTTASSTPPVLELVGATPATLYIGETYIDLGATITGPAGALNLGVYATLDGGATTTPSEISIDTSAAGEHSIIYSATDQGGRVGYAYRSVLVVDPNATP